MDALVVTVMASRIEAERIAGLLRSDRLWAAVSAEDAGGPGAQLQQQGRSCTRRHLRDVLGPVGSSAEAGAPDAP